MTKAEFAAICAAMRTYYPREPLFPNEHAIELWFKQLREFSAPAMQSALEFWVKRNKFSPSIAELSQLTKDVQDGHILDWNELADMKRAGVARLDQKQKELEILLQKEGTAVRKAINVLQEEEEK